MLWLNPTDFGRDKDSFHQKFQNALFSILDLKNWSRRISNEIENLVALYLKFSSVLNVVKLQFKLELIAVFIS